MVSKKPFESSFFFFFFHICPVIKTRVKFHDTPIYRTNTEHTFISDFITRRLVLKIFYVTRNFQLSRPDNFEAGEEEVLTKKKINLIALDWTRNLNSKWNFACFAVARVRTHNFNISDEHRAHVRHTFMSDFITRRSVLEILFFTWNFRLSRPDNFETGGKEVLPKKKKKSTWLRRVEREKTLKFQTQNKLTYVFKTKTRFEKS